MTQRPPAKKSCASPSSGWSTYPSVWLVGSDMSCDTSCRCGSVTGRVRRSIRVRGSPVQRPGRAHSPGGAVLEHARSRSHESLGVITMGIKHATRLEEALRLRLRDLPDLDDFFDESLEERFFVKNLERVQGDERDAIILPVGYGKNAANRLVHRFGPLLMQGGER